MSFCPKHVLLNIYKKFQCLFAIFNGEFLSHVFAHCLRHSPLNIIENPIEFSYKYLRGRAYRLNLRFFHSGYTIPNFKLFRYSLRGNGYIVEILKYFLDYCKTEFDKMGKEFLNICRNNLKNREFDKEDRSPFMCQMQFTKDDLGHEVLLKDGKFQVMMQWEKPYMQACIDALKPTGDVLEVGFGCGYSATHIQTYHPKS